VPAPTTPGESAAKPPAGGTAGAPSLPTAATTADTTSAADAAIAEQLRELSHGKFDHIIGSKKDGGAIDAFYSKRNYAPVWLTDGKPNPRAEAAISYLGHVDADGLDPADYPVPDFAASTDPAALAEAELKLTTSVITFAHHAAVGRVHWSRISPDIEYHDAVPDPADVLAKLVATKDVAAALDSYEPHARGYLALKAKLAELRAGRGGAGKTPIAYGPVPKVGAEDRRVPQLRERLGVLSDGGMTYDKAVADAVKRFQQEHELKPTGMLTAATIEALNGREPEHPIDIILANMERWRWMPHDLGKTYVIVNLPDYTLRVMHDGKQVWMTKIVIGKPSMPTPIMTAEMKYITINPTWNVPPSIVNNEYLPALQQDPTALERMGLVVTRNPDGTIRIYQPPGDRNALGRIRFNFPNKFLVYQHDTPDKYMFAYDKRAFSHGCMRVLNPPKYAEVLLSLVRPEDGYTIERIEKMYGPEEKNIEFPTSIPVHLTYQTAFVDDAGKLQFRDDIYGRDKTLLTWLKGTGEERKVADIAVEHRENITHRQILAMPDSPALFGGRNVFGNGRFDDGGNFFSRLFGGAFAAAPAPPQPVPHRYR
jgi:murein L,D-transpeptidase YcbB/YkuD